MGGRKGGSSGRLESMLLGPARAVSFLFCTVKNGVFILHPLGALSARNAKYPMG